MGCPLPVGCSGGVHYMSISSTTALNITTTSLAKQTEYNDLRYKKKNESSGITITVGTSQPTDKSVW